MTDNVQVSKDIRSAIKAGNVERAISLISVDPTRLHMTTPFGT
jgi:hypothetical protein